MIGKYSKSGMTVSINNCAGFTAAKKKRLSWTAVGGFQQLGLPTLAQYQWRDWDTVATINQVIQTSYLPPLLLTTFQRAIISPTFEFCFALFTPAVDRYRKPTKKSQHYRPINDSLPPFFVGGSVPMGKQLKTIKNVPFFKIGLKLIKMWFALKTNANHNNFGGILARKSGLHVWFRASKVPYFGT